MEKSPVEEIKEDEGFTIAEFAQACGLSTGAAIHAIKAETKELNPKVLDTLVELGYDRQKLKKDYQEYREERQKELLNS